jgi:hypothetical protein
MDADKVISDPDFSPAALAKYTAGNLGIPQSRIEGHDTSSPTKFLFGQAGLDRQAWASPAYGAEVSGSTSSCVGVPGYN